MKIGLDFDNTIACYEHVFHAVALELGLISLTVEPTKLGVRSFLRDSNQEAAWTELQGIVYTQKMDETLPYPNAKEVMRWMVEAGYHVSIISHKTKYPFVGPKVNLRSVASQWIEKSLVDETGPLIKRENINFLETKTEKIARIRELNCDVFVDDLVDVLLDENFPKPVERVLFDPGNYYAGASDLKGIARIQDWAELPRVIETG